ncbi:hypothetical protein J31TS3_39920 [Paenibacillus lactis]|nr:hypothetical protein J31TS3_39920 [Paenibacillus lactis]
MEAGAPFGAAVLVLLCWCCNAVDPIFGATMPVLYSISKNDTAFYSEPAPSI